MVLGSGFLASFLAAAGISLSCCAFRAIKANPGSSCQIVFRLRHGPSTGSGWRGIVESLRPDWSSDAEFMRYAEASDVDNAVVRWLYDTIGITTDVVDAINDEVDRVLPPRSAFSG